MTVTFPFAKTEDCTQNFYSSSQLTDATWSSTKVYEPRFGVKSSSGSFFKPTILTRESFLDAQARTLDIQSRNVIPLSKVKSWQLTVLRSIAKLASLPDGWDSYGSPRIQPAALAGAFRLVLAIQIEESPIPKVCPVPGGGIQLEWQTSTHELELEILPDGSVEFLTVTEGDQMEEGCLSLDQIGEAKKLVRWLIDK